MQLKVSCPECGTYFHLDRKKIPPDGLRAKCSVCSAVIPVHSETEDDPPAASAATDSTTEEEPTVSHQVVHSRSSREDLLAMMLVAERERREMAWEMTRELFRLREVVERQQMVVAKLVETVSNRNTVRLDGNSSSTVEHDSETSAPALARQQELEEELRRLETTLGREKEIVERLRRGKLELERRAAQAEATIETLQQRGFLQRLLGRKR
jgi:predicted Zn finger-like uncharacterized protein